MDRKELFTLTATELAQKIREQKVTSEEVVHAVFENIDKYEYNIHAYLDFWKEESLKKAREIDETIANRGVLDDLSDLPLLGVPVAVKDNLLLSGKKTTCGSKMLQEFVAPYSATCVEKLEKAGAIIIGKTNMDEFGMGASTEHSFYGATRNPKDPTRVPGGSSGGSAAAVAYGGAFAALGTDTGGSIRQPAAFCGLVGLRPSYGSVSRHGLTAFASSMDVAGPITRSTRDAAALFNIVIGPDEKDQTSVSTPKVDLEKMESYDLCGKRIAIPKQLFSEETKENNEAMSRAVEFCRENGALVEKIDMPILDYAIAIYYILSSAEASANLSRYDGIRYGYRASGAEDITELYRKTRTEGFGKEVKRRILLGNYVLSSEHFNDCYRQAERARNMLKKAFDEAFSKYDLLLCPTAPGEAPLLGEIDKDPLSTYLADLCMVPASLAGLPAVSLPFAATEKALPVGIQFIGPRFGEQEILGAARFLEKGGQKR
ncbi:MAG: Asp-tRNA(Asn)/Glu-tRNA(Gln) amidotransferase subunit GatA [Clostridiales bacterium]|nr:Asp-tRNA(Asn)/Glu-tRNA(Gln) amidotransferase subunit GatA [Clostridiales bacterium]